MSSASSQALLRRTYLANFALVTMGFFVPVAAGCAGQSLDGEQSSLSVHVETEAGGHDYSATKVEVLDQMPALLDRYFKPSTAATIDPAVLLDGDVHDVLLKGGTTLRVHRDGDLVRIATGDARLDSIAIQLADGGRRIRLLAASVTPVASVVLDTDDVAVMTEIAGTIALGVFGEMVSRRAAPGRLRDGLVEKGLLWALMVTLAVAALAYLGMGGLDGGRSPDSPAGGNGAPGNGGTPTFSPGTTQALDNGNKLKGGIVGMLQKNADALGDALATSKKADPCPPLPEGAKECP